jgi:hypothetical protein
LTEMSAETGTATPPDDSNLYRRFWQDLQTWRLVVGLTVAPLPPILLGGVLNVFGVSISFAAGPWVPPLSFIWMALPAEFWSIAFGLFYLLTSPRRSGAITRGNCIFVGGLAAALFLPMLTVLFVGTMRVAAESLAMMALPYSLLGGLFLTPLGVLGGWIFWLIGVRPAKLRAVGVGDVFA